MADAVYVVAGGHSIETNRLKGTGTEPKFCGWGTGATAALPADTGLETAAAEARTDGTSTQQTTTVANDTYQVIAAITCAGAGKTITEIALYDALTAGNVYLHGTFSGIPLSISDAVQFTIKVKYTNA